MELAASEAECWVDKHAVKRQMDAHAPQAGADHNSFDAVGILRQTTDQKDKYYIYNIENKNFLEFGELAGTDHVFKSSTNFLLSFSMNEDAQENILQLGNAYFDSTHTQVYGFKAFGLWLTHPAMKQIIQLASMEIQSKNYVHVAVFFKLFNRMLPEIKDMPAMFKPRYFICDEGGDKYKAIHEVYGDFFARNMWRAASGNFKSDVRKHAVKVSEDRRPRFEEICNEMCEVTTVKGFNILMAELRGFAVNFPELKGFVE